VSQKRDAILNMAITSSVLDQFAKFFHAAKSTKFSTKLILGYLLMVEQRISNVSTGRLYFWSDFRPFVNKLLQTICIFSCVFGSSDFCPWCQIFTVLMLDVQ